MSYFPFLRLAAGKKATLVAEILPPIHFMWEIQNVIYLSVFTREILIFHDIPSQVLRQMSLKSG
jgi:hypothetical protein